MAAAVFFSLLVLFPCFGSPGASARTAESFRVVPLSSLLPSDVCSASEGTDGAELKVIHRHGPCSALRREQRPSHADILRMDESRVKSMQSRVLSARSSSDSSVTESSSLPTRIGDSLNTANYVVTVGLGTPKKDFTVIFDTGSDLTWVQCQPCATSCHSQKDPIFNPAGSSTFRNLSCGSPECLGLRTSTGNPGSCDVSSTCTYSITYGDGSYSDGFLAADTLTLSDSVAGFRFGCGEDNDGLFGETAGLLGLGRDSVSVISQTANQFGRVFSYCLPSKSSSTGFLSFGPKISSSVKFTHLDESQSLDSFYFLKMVGITVSGQKLPVAPSVFATSGTIIDSGTVVTRLPPAAYAALRSAFRRGMARYPSAPSLSILDTCYDLSKYPTVTVPKVGLLFDGGLEVDLAAQGIFYVASASQACLAFAGNSDASDVGIFGNIQQKTYEVVYDVGNKRVGFGGGGCG